MRTIRVEVTSEDIAAGEQDNTCTCPVSLAIRRACPGTHPLVYGHMIKWADDAAGEDMPWKLAAAPIPMAVGAFVSAFDEGQDVEPFAFELDIP